MKSWIRRSSAALSICVLLGSTTTQAQEPARGAKTANERERAAELAVEGVRLYRAGRHAEAARMFLEAYAISHRPAQLRNAAKAYEEGGMLSESAELWSRYRDHEGVNADEKSEAEAHLALIAEKKRYESIAKSAEAAAAAATQAKAAAEQAVSQAVEAQKTREVAPTPAPAVVTQAPVVDQGPPVGGYVVLGGGAAAVVTGGIVFLLSSSKLSKLDEKLKPDQDGLIRMISKEDAESEVSSINTMRVVSGVLVAVGAAGIGTGIGWLLSGGSDEPATGGQIRAGVAMTPTGGEIGISGRF